MEPDLSRIKVVGLLHLQSIGRSRLQTVLDCPDTEGKFKQIAKQVNVPSIGAVADPFYFRLSLLNPVQDRSYR
jgi:hypothetical protein